METNKAQDISKESIQYSVCNVHVALDELDTSIEVLSSRTLPIRRTYPSDPSMQSVGVVPEAHSQTRIDIDMARDRIAKTAQLIRELTAEMEL